ncbi:hypothetical protein MON38_05335 [Hymenobacter sp. DH14]|uniref:Uncharacterized protein n=1 Tax=Hymenobacter cyanobacteriorum TaxID=2926463 RepID=A0A9X2AFS0_9BACT|nr:hypothetical protein [Hymenobacter cyanobacteriorum]MCI1186833.1 hypothetical protein [Hymenobacter cyanobacteriorum]
MRRLYSLFFYCFSIISPTASAEQVSDNSFLLLCFALYFPLSFVAHFCEVAFACNIGVWGVVGLLAGMSIVLYQMLLAEGKWKRIVAQYPMRPVRKGDIYLGMGLLLLAGLASVFVPVL